MDDQRVRQLLQAVQGGRLGIDDALAQLNPPAPAELPFANLDHDRARRTGVPEVIFCQGKTPEQVVRIAGHLLHHEGRVLGTRASPEVAQAVLAAYPTAQYHPLARTIILIDGALEDQASHLPETPSDSLGSQPPPPYIVVATGGTSDIPVAEEAAQTLDFLGDQAVRTYDVGVAGIHRLLRRQELLRGASVVLAVAGMEGALASVVAGLVDCPVIAVPTSIGYGASFGGLAALLSMLNACAPGVSVVNIDNGFGAAVVAHQILRASDAAAVRVTSAKNGNGACA
jgi:pyridinium-3,5-biscarboxylic acid mononucleotide synthase